MYRISIQKLRPGVAARTARVFVCLNVLVGMAGCGGVLSTVVNPRSEQYTFAGKKIGVFVAVGGDEHGAASNERVASQLARGRQEGIWYADEGLSSSAQYDIGSITIPTPPSNSSSKIFNHPRMEELSNTVAASVLKRLKVKGYVATRRDMGGDAVPILELLERARSQGDDLAAVVTIATTRSWNRRVSANLSSNETINPSSFVWATERGGMVIPAIAIYDTRSEEVVWAHHWRTMDLDWATIVLAELWDDNLRQRKWQDDYAGYRMSLYTASSKRAVAVLFSGGNRNFLPLPVVRTYSQNDSAASSENVAYADSELVLFKGSMGEGLWQAAYITRDHAKSVELRPAPLRSTDSPLPVRRVPKTQVVSYPDSDPPPFVYVVSLSVGGGMEPWRYVRRIDRRVIVSALGKKLRPFIGRLRFAI